MGFGTAYTHGVEQFRGAVLVRGIRVELDAVALDGELGERRRTRLAEHTGHEVEVVGYFMVFVLGLHLRAVIRIVTLASAGSADEIEGTVIGSEGTAFHTGHVGVGVDLHMRRVCDRAFHHGACIRVNRTDDLVAVVVSLDSEVYLTLLEDRQHEFAEERCLGIHGVSRTGEDILMREGNTILGVRVFLYLLAEPPAYIIGEVGRFHGSFARRGTPPVLKRINEEEDVAIDEGVGNAMELRAIGSRHGHREVGRRIEMVIVVEQGAVIVVTIGRHDRHLHDHRSDGFFEPALPLPFGVRVCTCLHEVAREEAEARFGYGVRSRGSAPFGILHILGILDMAIGHIEEGVFALRRTLGTEMGDGAPVSFVSDTPRVGSTRREVGSNRLMAHVFESGLVGHLSSLQQSGSGNGVTEILGDGRGSLQGQDIGSLEIRRHGTGFRYNLHFAVHDSFVGEPRKRHVRARVAVYIGYHAVGFLFRDEFGSRFVHRSNLIGDSCYLLIRSPEAIHACGLFSNPEGDEGRDGVVLDRVERICFQNLMGVEDRRFGSYHSNHEIGESAVFAGSPDDSLSFRHAGHHAADVHRSNGRIIGGPGQFLVGRLARGEDDGSRSRTLGVDKERVLEDIYSLQRNSRCIGVIFVRPHIHTFAQRPSHTGEVIGRSFRRRAFVNKERARLNRPVGRLHLRYLCGSLRNPDEGSRRHEMGSVCCAIIGIEAKRDERRGVESLVSNVMARRAAGNIVRRVCKSVLSSVSPHDGVIYLFVGMDTGIFGAVVISEGTVGDNTGRVIDTTGVRPAISACVIIEHAVGDCTTTQYNRTITAFATANDTVLYGRILAMYSTCRTGGRTELYKTIADNTGKSFVILLCIDSRRRLRVAVADDTIVEGHVAAHIRCATGRSIL